MSNQPYDVALEVGAESSEDEEYLQQRRLNASNTKLETSGDSASLQEDNLANSGTSELVNFQESGNRGAGEDNFLLEEARAIEGRNESSRNRHRRGAMAQDGNAIERIKDSLEEGEEGV